MIDLDALVRSANEIEPLPTTVTALITLTSQENWSWKQVVELIKRDPMMASRVLRLANSAAYRRNTATSRIEDAVLKLGISNVMSISIAANVRGSMSKAIPSLGMDEGQLWRHSIAASLVPEILGTMLGIQIPEEAPAAALLHDIGKIVMARFIHETEIDILKQACQIVHNPFAAESEIFNVNHAEVGGIIAQKWNLPQSIVDAIIYHHSPAPEHGLGCDVVYLANLVANYYAPTDYPPVNPPLDPGVAERLGLDEVHFQKLIDTVNERVEEVLSHYAS